MVEASESGFRGPKQINHVALSVSPELLGQRGRADLASFFENVFGWAELDMMTIDGQRMIFSVNSSISSLEQNKEDSSATSACRVASAVADQAGGLRHTVANQGCSSRGRPLGR